VIFFDTGAWVALALSGDRNAAKARAFLAEVSRGAHGAVVTSSFVLDEVATLLRMAADVPSASRFLHSVLDSRSVTVVWIDPVHFRTAFELFAGHPDKRWSFTDCTSFVVMRDLNIQTAFGFDRNFEQAGLTRLP